MSMYMGEVERKSVGCMPINHFGMAIVDIPFQILDLDVPLINVV